MTIAKSLKLITKNWLLISILILAAVIRLWNLSSVPPHLTPDEAALGYNAYSILETGRDEYGEFLPTIFKSFGDYKPGLYVYLTVPFVALLGLTEFAVRLPSALAGIIAVWLLYKIVLLLFAKQSNHTRYTNHQTLGKIAAFLLAISPWHIHFSRGAWEVNVALTLTLVGVYFFLRALRESKYLYYSALFFALTLLTYQGAKLSTAIVISILVITFWKEVKRWIISERRNLTGTIFVFLVIALPVILSIFQGKTGRLEVFSIFSYSRSGQDIQVILDQGSERIKDISYSLFHPEGLFATRGVLSRWLNHYSARFLFFEGDWQNPRHSAPNQGMLLMADLVLLIAGFVGLVRTKGKASLFIFLWLILSPLPAALSRDQVHAVRSLNMVIPLTIISSVGVLFLIQVVEKQVNKYRYLFFSFLVLMFFSSFVYFLDSYFVHLPVHNAKHWLYGYKQVVEEITPIQSNYKRIVFQQSYNQPYIYFLFHQKYDPASYQKQAKLTESGIDVGLVENLGNISFEPFSWPYPTDKKGILVVGDSIAIPDDFNENGYKLISEVRYPDGFQTAFRVVEVK